MSNNYYEVVAKCGHVGRQNYYEGHFFVKALSKSEAAIKVKSFPRVKKDHNDAILAVYSINQEEYICGIEKERENPYFQCGSKHQQNDCWSVIMEGVRPETDNQLSYRKKRQRYNTEDILSDNYGIRNKYKYQKMNRADSLKYDFVA